MTELEKKQTELARLLQQYDQISTAMFSRDVTPEHQGAFSRRQDALAVPINRLIREITELSGDPGHAPIVLNNPRVKINPLLDLFTSGAIDPAELYRPTREQKQRQADQGRICSLGGGLD
jgi:trehalose-6-phosphate synthase